MKALSSVLIVVAMAQASPLKQESSQPDKEVVMCAVQDACSLRGKPTVSVSVGIGGDVKGAGLSITQLKTDIELELRRHDIKVNEGSDTELHVSVNGFRFDESRFAYHVDIYCIQTVRLIRDANVVVFGATTWSANGMIGVHQSRSLNKVVSEGVHGLTRQFANAYLSANN